MLSLVPTFVIRFSAHCVFSGSCSHVSGFLCFAGAAVVSFCNFVTTAPIVAVLRYVCRVAGSIWACSGAVGSGSSYGKFLGECCDG